MRGADPAPPPGRGSPQLSGTSRREYPAAKRCWPVAARRGGEQPLPGSAARYGPFSDVASSSGRYRGSPAAGIPDGGPVTRALLMNAGHGSCPPPDGSAAVRTWSPLSSRSCAAQLFAAGHGGPGRAARRLDVIPRRPVRGAATSVQPRGGPCPPARRRARAARPGGVVVAVTVLQAAAAQTRNTGAAHPALGPGQGADFYSGLDAGPGYGLTACLRRSSTRPGGPAHSVGHVHLATPLAVGAGNRRPRRARPRCRDGPDHSGQGSASSRTACPRIRFDLVLATVGQYRQPANLVAAGGAAAANPDARYWQDEVPPC